MLRLLLALTLLTPLFAHAEEIPTSNPLRQELFTTIRPQAEKLAKEPVKFQGSLRRDGEWAVFTGEIVRKDGTPIPVGDNESSDTFALWQLKGKTWKLIDFSIGHTDVFYLDYPTKYGVHKELLFDNR